MELKTNTRFSSVREWGCFLLAEIGQVLVFHAASTVETPLCFSHTVCSPSVSILSLSLIDMTVWQGSCREHKFSYQLVFGDIRKAGGAKLCHTG